MTFDEFGISEPILKAITEKGYVTPTPIQEQAIPIALSGKDLLGTAQTGTGKTAAFAIPIIEQLLKDSAPEKEEGRNKDKGKDKGKFRGKERNKEKAALDRQIRALILTPTRELAAQISDCFRDYSKHTGLRQCVIFGGVKQKPQTEKLLKGVDILIATPGRLGDLMGQGFISLDYVKHFVLDEADRMLDMGFIGDIKRLLPKLPTDRQTLFFSATMPSAIVSLSHSMLHHPSRIEISPEAPVVETIDQMIYFVEKTDKKDLLIELLRKHKGESVLVFSRTKHGADKITKILSKAGIPSDSIHGDKTQGARERALANFKSGKTRVMIATDIAARGLDINDLPIVINYDMPDLAETYVHRIGRTGRAGKRGRAISFCSMEEHMLFREIQQMAGKAIHSELYPSY